MITAKINNTEITAYGSIKEMPVTRYKLMQQYLLQESGLGSTMEDIDRRLISLMTFAGHGKTDEVREEANNLRFSIFSTLNGLDYKNKALACFIVNIGPKKCDDLSNDGISRTVEYLEKIGSNVGELEELWEMVKKNLIQN